ncbi:MAG: hypothetical protein AAGD43_16285 [Pseudomonadota bacterium]
MADIVLKVGAASGYEDCDVLCAFNDRRISQVHAEHIASPKLRPDLNPRIGSADRGFIVRGTLAEVMCSQVFRYRFERQSKTAVKRIDLITKQEVIIDGTPRIIDGKRQAMDVELFIKRRILKDNHGIFGNEANAVWYGKARIPGKANLSDVWDRIEDEAKLMRSDHTLFPLTERERAVHLPIAFADFDDATASAHVSPLVDETDPDNPVTIKKRSKLIEYPKIFADRSEKITDKSLIEDLRDQVGRTTEDLKTKTIEK